MKNKKKPFQVAYLLEPYKDVYTVRLYQSYKKWS